MEEIIPGPVQSQANQFHKNVRDSLKIFRTCGLEMREAIAIFRATYINLTLADCAGNQCRAARLLHIHRNTLAREIARMRQKGLLTASLRSGGNYRRRKQVERVKVQAREMGVRVGSA